MNDVKITELSAGALYVNDRILLLDDEAAALEAHYRAKFAAEQPATPTPSTEQVRDALWASIDGKGIRGRLYREDCEYLAGVVVAALVVRNRDITESHGSDTPNTEQIKAALDEYRSRLEEEDPAIQRLNKTDPYVVASIFNQGYQAALVSPVSEQPTPLDPEPWEYFEGWPLRSAQAERRAGFFKPRPEFEQDRARYEQGGA